METENPAIEVATFKKNSRETVRVELTEFKSYGLVHIRSWASKDDGTAIPTRSGISIQTHLIPQLRAALDEAEKRVREIGWLSP